MMFTHLKAVRKVYSMKDLRLVHRQALAAVRELETNEVRVITSLQECDRLLVYRFIGYGSLVSYAVEALELSKHQAYDYTSVARKAAELPDLQECLLRGEVSVAKARRVMSVITPENCEWWLKLLKSSSKREIEKAVAHARGEEGRKSNCEIDNQAHSESEQNEHSVKLQLDGELAQRFARVRAVGESAHLRSLSDEEMLVELMDFYLRQQATDLRLK